MSELVQLIGATKEARDRCNAESGGLQNVTISMSADGVVVTGNKAGLLELARLILMVASKERSGSHQDIDTNSFASKADGVLTIALDNTLV